ncbi:MAG: manganese efflux pump MntP family protein [Dehalococcoidia bacterium]|nr:manganese efflux pump MntP family protein [Dehalococcoidia bacterium]
MDIPSLILAAFSLSADCFAVALSGSAAMPTVSRRQVFRTSLSFGFFQFLMPVLGWFAGRTFVDKISAYDHWIAFALLTFVGGKALVESLRKSKTDDNVANDISKGKALIALSIATSIDALAVGVGMAALKVNIMSTSFVIGLVAFAVTAGGFAIGRRAGRLLGKRARMAGGIVLIGIGLRILLSGILS